jgi:flagellar biosynthesis/type III secretory pathway M-ring protein FliF/YscJ
MHGKNSSLGQVWVQLALLVVGTVLFGWIDRKAERQRRLKAAAKARQQVIADGTGGGGERYSVNTKDARSGRDTSTA